MRRKTHLEFLDEISKANPRVRIRGTYINCSTKIEVECLSCGYIWESNPTTLCKGHGCPKCANNLRKAPDDFVAELHEINPHIELLEQYKTALKPIKVRCIICGNEWIAKPARLLNGAQCMNCVKPHTSFMEQFLLLSFQSVLGSELVISRDTEAIGQELDIFIPQHQLAIEPGSWLYHKSKVHDIDYEKRILCKEKGIRLITIYDTYPGNTSPPYEEDCFVYTGFLNERGYERLKNLIIELLSMIGYSNVTIDWQEIANRAYEFCHYNAHEAFVNRLKGMHPNIEVLEKYQGANIPILVDNTLCGHKPWKARPYTLLNGNGCPECGKLIAATSRQRTHDEFVKKLNTINPNIQVNGRYTKATDRIAVECLICGNRWEPLGYSLTQGKGCPHCSAVAAAKARVGKLSAKTTELFVLEIEKKNPQIEICSEYVNSKTKIKAKCRFCGHQWEVVPASLTNGHGCPRCAKKQKQHPQNVR